MVGGAFTLAGEEGRHAVAVKRTRVGETIILGATTWQIEDITHDRVLVTPAFGRPGRLPFWRGDQPGRPLELGRATGAFRREALADPNITARLTAAGLDANARTNLLNYLTEQRDATGHLPTDTTVVVERFRDELGDWRVDGDYSERVTALDADWQKVIDECYHRDHGPLPAQTEVFGALNELMDPTDVVINAAGSMPGDLQSLWRARTPQQYHVEYAYSCMGYEIPAALGVRMAKGDAGQVVAIVGDGTYQMMPMELATIVSEGLKVIVVLLQNHGFASIGSLSESRGSQRFGTKYRMRNSATGRLDGENVPFDLAVNAASWGADVLRCNGIAQFRENYVKAAASDRTTVLYIETDLTGPNPPGTAWWDVPVSQVSELDSTRTAFEEYQAEQAGQRHYL